MEKLEAEIKLLDNKKRFLHYMINKDNLSTFTTKKRSVRYFISIITLHRSELVPHLKEIGIESLDGTDSEKGYSYVLNLPIWNLTTDQIERITQQYTEKKKEYENLRATESKQLWKDDLIKLKEHLLHLNREYVQ